MVNAGGMYAAEIGRMAGVRIPVIPFAHEYLVTQPFRERGGGRCRRCATRPADLLPRGGRRARDGRLRARLGAVVAARRRRGLDEIPPDFNGRLLEDDWDRFEEIVVNSRRRVPAMEDVKVTKLINGPEAFTPDGEFCLGETAVRGLYVAAGFCAHGLAGAGGIGKVMAEWIVEGEPSLDVWHMDIRRFGEHYRSPRYTLDRTREVYETYYDIKYPNHERTAGRPLRMSPVYPWHEAHGAVFGEKSGWERVNWYAANEAAGDESLRPRGWAGRHWSPAIGAEHRACREAAALFDESSFAKLEVTGPGAAEFLERLAANRVAREIGKVTYTQMLNRRGGIECDFTVTRLEEDRFGIVTGTAFGNHDLAWIRSHLPAAGSADVRVANVTSQWACFALWGPRARDVLRGCTTADLATEAFPYMTLPRDRRRRRAGPRAARHLRRRAGLGALLPGRVRRRAVADAVGARARGTASSPAATARSTRCGWRRATACGAPTSRPTSTRSRPGSASRSSSTRASSSAARRCCARATRATRAAALLPRARRPALGRALQRAGADRRAGARARHERRLRLHGRGLDRLRLPAARARRAGHRGGGGDLRRVGRRPRRARAAARPGGRAGARLARVARLGLLDGPAVAVGIAEEHERAPRHVVDVGDLHAAAPSAGRAPPRCPRRRAGAP